MSSTLNRLRRLHGLGKKSTKSQTDQASANLTPKNASSPLRSSSKTTGNQNPLAYQGDSGLTQPLDKAVPGVELHNDGGACYAVAYSVPLSTERKGASLSALLSYSADHLHRFHPKFNLNKNAQFRSAAFLDTETTGLGAGAGVYCFMVGIGRFESHAQLGELTQAEVWDDPALAYGDQGTSKPPTHFVVRQLFMRRPSEECALLTALASLLNGCSMTVTFNGRVFDLPLLRTRYQQNQRLLPTHSQIIPLLSEDATHLDLLIPSRRLWRRRLDSCRLVWLEQQILGLERTSDDVPGHMIPLLYAQYVGNPQGEAGHMPGIFYHNREDITSMASLTARVYKLFGHLHPSGLAKSSGPAELSPAKPSGPAEPKNDLTEPTDALDGLDWLALGCCCEAIDDVEKAEHAFLRALELLGNGRRALSGRIEGYRRLGNLYKRRGAWREATTIWQQWLTTADDNDPRPYIELAKYCEWQASDLEQAEMWTRWALHNVENSPRQVGKSVSLINELNHRLSRIRRKREGSTGR